MSLVQTDLFDPREGTATELALARHEFSEADLDHRRVTSGSVARWNWDEVRRANGRMAAAHARLSAAEARVQ